MDSFGIKLKRLRAEKELTQKELSSLLGLTRATMLGLSDINTFDTSYLTDQQELIIRALLDEFRGRNSKI